MALTLTIGGTARSSYLMVGSISIRDELNSRNTCEFLLRDPAGSYSPTVGQSVTLARDGTTVFAGTIDEPERAFPVPGEVLDTYCRCVDYNQLADRHLVARVYESDALGYLALSFTMAAVGDAYLFVDATSITDYTVQSGDYLEYDIYWPAGATNIQTAMDIWASDNSKLSAAGVSDQNSVSAAVTTNLRSYANGEWYHRRIALPGGWTGKVIDRWLFCCHYDSGGTITARVRNVWITDGAGDIRKDVWSEASALPTFAEEEDSTDGDPNYSQTYSFSKTDDTTAGAIVRDIVRQDLDGESIRTDSVQDGPLVAKAVFNYRSTAQAFDELSELTGYAWNVDYDKILNFFARETNAAPFGLTGTSKNFRDMRVKTTRERYRNRQYIRAGQDITDSRTETFVGDGERKTFSLAFAAATVPTITVDAVSKTVGIRGVDTGKDWYWSKGEKEISQDDGGTALGAGNTLSITYQGFFPIVVSGENEAEISSRASVEGGTGVYEAVEDDASLDSVQLASDKADGMVRRYGTIPEVITFETDTNGLEAGQIININVTDFSINDDYLIGSVETRDLTTSLLRYQVTAYSGEHLGSWVEFFKRIAGAGKLLLRESEVLVVGRRTEDAVSISDTLTPTTGAATCAVVGTAVVGECEICS